MWHSCFNSLGLISVLEASYICYLLKPDFNNYVKRLIKAPKLYFYDTGLACSLLNIQNAEQVSTHFLRGGLFENLVINEFIKKSFNQGVEPVLSFWRDSTGNEVDLLHYVDGKPYAYEIKSGATYNADFLKAFPNGQIIGGRAASMCRSLQRRHEHFHIVRKCCQMVGTFEKTNGIYLNKI